jgi:hypothetical protein
MPYCPRVTVITRRFPAHRARIGHGLFVPNQGRHDDELRFQVATHMSARCTLDPVIDEPEESGESDEADKSDQAYDSASRWPPVTINKAEETFRELQAMPVERRGRPA